MADAPTPQETSALDRRRLPLPGGLSARLLLLTVLFVVLGGALTLPPALAAYERQWLLDRVRAAELASLAPEVAPDRVVSEQHKAQFLNGAGVDIVAVSVDGARRLVFARPRPAGPQAPYLVDLRERAPGLGWLAPFRTLLGPDGRRVRVVAEPRFRKADFVEFVASDGELKRALASYLWRLVAIVAFVSTITGVLVYATLALFLVRPMQRITLAMERFRADPEDPAARVLLSGRRDEVGRAEAELDRMQADLRTALHSRARSSLGRVAVTLGSFSAASRSEAIWALVSMLRRSWLILATASPSAARRALECSAVRRSACMRSSSASARPTSSRRPESRTRAAGSSGSARNRSMASVIRCIGRTRKRLSAT